MKEKDSAGDETEDGQPPAKKVNVQAGSAAIPLGWERVPKSPAVQGGSSSCAFPIPHLQPDTPKKYHDTDGRILWAMPDCRLYHTHPGVTYCVPQFKKVCAVAGPGQRRQMWYTGDR